MSSVQKIIKYTSIAFAVFLVISIITFITSLVIRFGSSLATKESKHLESVDINGDYSVLNIDLKSVNLKISDGEYFHVETNNNSIDFKQSKNKLYITQTDINWFSDSNDLIIYIPSSLVLDSVNINAGAGKLNINNLSSKKLVLKLGAGKTDINNLNISEATRIDGGAGEVSVTNSSINNLDFNIGVGKALLNSSLSGNNKIDAGIGEVNLELIGTLNDYKIKIKKGIGSSKINDKSVTNNKNYGIGNSTIDIDGGIGSINIDFVK